jgi:sugar/nucleoside kinase (ribokinase family)
MGFDVIGLGLATLDILIRLKDLPTWEHGAGFSSISLDGGGPVGTACVAAARLGARVGFVGTAGNDQLAKLKLHSFREDGVDLSRLVGRSEPENQVVVVYVSQITGERVFSWLHGFGRKPLHVEELDHTYITSANYLHLDGTHHEAARQAAEWMHAAGKLVSLDCAKTEGNLIGDELRELVPYADILICGSGFGRSLTGHADLMRAGEAMLSLGPRLVVQTEGREGSYTITSEDHFHTPAFDVKVVDTTGAGDVFHGAYLVGLLHGWDLRITSLFATAVSAIKCTRLGGRIGIPTFDKTLTFLHQRGYDQIL